MGDFRRHFADFAGRVWLGASHQGPLPEVARAEAIEAIAWKSRPFEMTTQRFTGVPARLRTAIGTLVSVDPDQVILTNGSSYGLHLLANGLPLGDGDEVLLVDRDFPSNHLPWLGLGELGVVVRKVQSRAPLPTRDEVERALGPKTRVVCMSWVHSFSGYVADLAALGELCRGRGVWLVVNCTQGVGARPLDLSHLPVDAVVCSGWKWLCGPYATGFAWIRPELLGRLHYNQHYWLSAQTADGLGAAAEAELRPPDGARRYDVFGTANFFNFKPWAASIELLLDIGIDRIREHDDALVQRLLDSVGALPYEVYSPTRPDARSSLVFLTHRDASRNRDVHGALAMAGIDTSLRHGRIRLAPHLYNTPAEIDRTIAALAEAGRSA